MFKRKLCSSLGRGVQSQIQVSVFTFTLLSKTLQNQLGVLNCYIEPFKINFMPSGGINHLGKYDYLLSYFVLDYKFLSCSLQCDAAARRRSAKLRVITAG